MLGHTEGEVVAWFRSRGLEGAGDVVCAEGVVARKTGSFGRLGKSGSHVDCCVCDVWMLVEVVVVLGE